MPEDGTLADGGVPIIVHHGLPFVAVIIRLGQREAELERILIDTGSMTSIFRTDDYLQVADHLPRFGRITWMHGIGDGEESVLDTEVDEIRVGSLRARPFPVQLGLLPYVPGMQGILGFDFLLATGAVVDLRNMILR